MSVASMVLVALVVGIGVGTLGGVGLVYALTQSQGVRSEAALQVVAGQDVVVKIDGSFSSSTVSLESGRSYHIEVQSDDKMLFDELVILGPGEALSLRFPSVNRNGEDNRSKDGYEGSTE